MIKVYSHVTVLRASSCPNQPHMPWASPGPDCRQSYQFGDLNFQSFTILARKCTWLVCFHSWCHTMFPWPHNLAHRLVTWAWLICSSLLPSERLRQINSQAEHSSQSCQSVVALPHWAHHVAISEPADTDLVHDCHTVLRNVLAINQICFSFCKLCSVSK